MIDALGRLGIAIDVPDAGQTLRGRRLRRQPAGRGGGAVRGQQRHHGPLSDGAGGAGPRQLIAWTARRGCASGRFKTCSTRLAQLGVRAHSERPGGCPPVVIEADGLRGGRATVRGDVSSQFLSGLLMAAPYAASPLELSIAGPLVSQPYIRMTLAVMKSFGVAIEADRLERFRIAAPLAYRAAQYAIEPDASAASYFWAAAAITGGRVAVEGLSRDESARRRRVLRLPGADGLPGRLRRAIE